MCLAIPAQVTAILSDGLIKISLDGVTKTISAALVDDVAVGDYVVVHTGFALTKIDAAEAQTTLALLAEMAALAGAEANPQVAP